MSDDKSQHDPLQTEGGEISAANGSREVENALPPLGSEETGENDAGVAPRTRLRRQRQQAAGADILDQSIKYKFCITITITNSNRRSTAGWFDRRTADLPSIADRPARCTGAL